jgi:hypothetical protein
MQKSTKIRRIPAPQEPISTRPALLRSAGGKRDTSPFWRRKSRGQSIVIIALSMILLVSVVALAVDGGSMYTQRRAAQNAADSAAIAGSKLFLTYLEAAVKIDPNPPDGTADQEHQIRTTIEQYAAANGVAANTIQAYFIDAQKRIVSVQANGNIGNPCGTSGGLSPCQVGNNGEVPWNLGAIGVTVSGQAQTAAYFVRILGWNTISASARATSMVELTNSVSNSAVLPLGLFTSTINIDNIQFGQTYTLINGDGSQGGGQWGWVTFNYDNGSANVAKAWLYCGFNPSVTVDTWAAWCPGTYSSVSGAAGPTRHYPSTINNPPTDFHPEPLPIPVRFLQYGPQASGWWLKASSGTTNSACSALYNHVVDDATNTPDGLGTYLYFPIFDATYDNGSEGLAYHIRAIASFFLNKPQGLSTDDISCRPQPLPTATPPPAPTPTATSVSGGGNNLKWFIRGKAVRFFDNTSSGRIGDIIHAFGRTVVLDR